MGDILDEAQSVVQCKTCPWYKTCVLPMKFTEEEIKRQIDSSLPGYMTQGTSDDAFKQLLSGMASAAQNTLLEACPVFINRLRSNPKLAEQIKKMMQEWSNVEDTETD
jgi:uncharacterized membrane-anchored protein YjiN (DUF445 family)